MSVRLPADSIDLSGVVRSGDTIVWSQACGEPLPLIEALIAQRAAIGPVAAFAGSSFSGVLRPEHTDYIRVLSMGALGALRQLSKAGVLGIVPCHVGQIGRMIENGQLACDVAFVQVSPADANGHHSYGIIGDYADAAVRKARVVVAEINAQMPYLHGDPQLAASDIDFFIETDRPLVTLERAPIRESDRATARHCAQFVEDGSVLQFGIGAVPDAIAQSIGDRRDLGVHSGMMGEALLDLYESGALTNATKSEFRGISVVGALMGSRALYDFADHNKAVALASSQVTHDEAILQAIPKLVSVNSAIEVDLTGAVNAETVGSSYAGATGGQVDYVRGGSRAAGGHAIIALPATAARGMASRIVPQLSGPVTTSRSEVDVIVTEYGAAQLRGLTLVERAKALIAIASPDFREGLERDAHSLFARGF